MKGFLSFLMLLTPLWIVLTSHGSKPKPPWEKENVSFPMMNQEIRHTMQENERQKEMQDKQLTNTTLEGANKEQWSKFKEVKVKIQDRLRIVSFAMQAIPSAAVIVQQSQKIKRTQQQLVEAVQSAPYSLAVALPQEIKFADDLQMVTRYMIGIVASYGAINEMEKVDRKILLDYAVSEVKRLEQSSRYSLLLVTEAIRKTNLKKSLLDYYVNRDKAVVRDILKQVKGY